MTGTNKKLEELGAAPHIVRDGATGLIARWRRFVGQVESGYPMGLDEYRNDLDIRGLIGAVGLDAEVQEEDRRLRSLLRFGGPEIWESEAPGAFWVQGYPANASGELLEDLRRDGLAE